MLLYKDISKKHRYMAAFEPFCCSFLIVVALVVLLPNTLLAADSPAERPGFRPGLDEDVFKPPEQPAKQFELQIPEASTVFSEGMTKIKLVLSKIDIQGNEVYDSAQLAEFYDGLIGKEISLADVYQVADKITKLYRKEGYLLSRALVPAQRIKDGVVHITILEGYVHGINVEGAGNMEDQIKSILEPIRKQRPVTLKVLERHLLLVSDLAGVTAKTVIRPSPENLGAVDLILQMGVEISSQQPKSDSSYGHLRAFF
jgi:hemolysin activation/secretion protein